MLNPNDVLSHISFLLVFLEGLLSFLSPCVFPLLPVYMGYLAGQDQKPVSYTHLDVYKRQQRWLPLMVWSN